MWQRTQKAVGSFPPRSRIATAGYVWGSWQVAQVIRFANPSGMLAGTAGIPAVTLTVCLALAGWSGWLWQTRQLLPLL